MTNHWSAPLRHAAYGGVQLASLALPRGRRRSMRRELWEKLFLADADLVMTSYPKSGRTWLRVMVSHVYHQRLGIDPRKLIEFDNFHRSDARCPRMLFTHQADNFYHPERLADGARAYRGKKVLLLVRHPLDVVVSRYHHLLHRSRDPNRRELTNADLGKFAMEPRGGLPTIVSYMNDWAREMRLRQDMTMVRYEDLRADPNGQLRRIFALIDPQVSDAEIAAAAEFGSFANMRRMEQEGFFDNSRVRARKQNDERSLKTRQGKINGFADAFAPEILGGLLAYLDAELDPIFGYCSVVPKRSGPTSAATIAVATTTAATIAAATIEPPDDTALPPAASLAL